MGCSSGQDDDEDIEENTGPWHMLFKQERPQGNYHAEPEKIG